MTAYYSFDNLYSDLKHYYPNMPDDKRAFLHGFCDFFGAGEATSFHTSDCEVLEDDVTPAPPGYEGESYCRPLEVGEGVEVEAYRAGWRAAGGKYD